MKVRLASPPAATPRIFRVSSSPPAGPHPPSGETATDPTPSNPQTTVRVGLPEASAITLVVYDVLGRQVRVLVDGTRAAGTHEVVFEAGNLPSGTYLVRFVTLAGSFV